MIRNIRVGFVALALAVGLASCRDAISPTTTPLPSAAVNGQADLTRYIVLFRPSAVNPSQLAQTLAKAYGARLIHIYTYVLRGMNVEMSAAAADQLSRDPRVAQVSPDGFIHLSGSQASPPSWGIDRIDARLDSVYHYAFDGTGVTAYILDTGINPSLPDFGGRASIGYDATGGDGIDCQGHGTHVAGTVGSATYGVAKNVQIVAVKVFTACTDSGPIGDAVMGMEWIATHHTGPSVANMSFATPKDIQSAPEDSAVAALTNSGVVTVAAAGNGPSDACTISPANAAQMAVGATDMNDTRWAYSNYGTCIALNAPGTDIVSDNYTGGPPLTKSGTSFAAPHVTGTAALILDAHPGLSVAQVKDTVLAYAEPGAIHSLTNGTPNLLVETTRLLISGATTVQKYGTCNWAATRAGGTPPYSYSWQVYTWENGQQTGPWVQPVGYNQSFTSQYYGAAFNTGFVTVTVNDAQGWPTTMQKALTFQEFTEGSCY